MKGSYTRYKLMAAFTALLDRYEFDDITVSKITSLCGVSRQAFYKNFESKQDLCRQMIATLFRDCLGDAESFTWEQLSEAYLGQMKLFMEFFHTLASRQYYMLTAEAIFGHVSKACRAMTGFSGAKKGDGDMEAVIGCYCIGVTHAYMTMISRGTTMDPILVTKRLRLAMPEALQRLMLGRVFPMRVHRDLFPGSENDGFRRFSAFLSRFRDE